MKVTLKFVLLASFALGVAACSASGSSASGSSAGTQVAIGSSENPLASEFPGAIQAVNGGYFTNADGLSSTTKVITNTSVAGNVVTATAKIAKGATGSQSALILGNATDNYVIYFTGAGHIGVSKSYGGAGANFADRAVTDTTNPKNFHLSVQFNATNNIVEGMIDGVAFGPFTDSVHIPTMPSPAGCTIQTGGGSGKLYSFTLESGLTHLKQSPQT